MRVASGLGSIFLGSGVILDPSQANGGSGAYIRHRSRRGTDLRGGGSVPNSSPPPPPVCINMR